MKLAKIKNIKFIGKQITYDICMEKNHNFILDNGILTHNTGEAQNSLRNLIESYYKNVRFICTANYENKIIEALRSRLTTYKFNQDNYEAITEHLRNICMKENVGIMDDVLLELINMCNGDIRKCIKKLQELSYLNRQITKEDIGKDKIMPSIINDLLLQRNFPVARQMLLDSNIEYDVFLDEYHDFIIDLAINKKLIIPTIASQIIKQLCEAMININYVISKEIIVENFLLQVIEVYKNDRKNN
jgi:DNA polymerase III delta prime subunit